MENGRPTYIWAVCVLTGRRQLQTSFEIVRARFAAQRHNKNARIVFVTAQPGLCNAPQTDTVRVISIDRPQTKLGELRNLAKTYIANEVIRDRDSHLVCHWEEADIYSEDYLAELSRVTTTDKISMFRSAVYYDAVAGYPCVKQYPNGLTATLAYSPFATFTFAPVVKNEFAHVQRQLQESPRQAKQMYKLELALLDMPATNLIRRYDGLNSELRDEFLKPPVRDLTPDELELVRDRLASDRAIVQQFY